MNFKENIISVILALYLFLFFSKGVSEELRSKIDTMEIYKEIKYLDDLWRNEYLNSNLFDLSDECRGDCGDIDYNISDKYVSNFLDSLSSHTPINLEYNPHVRPFIDFYLRNHKVIAKSIGLSKYYFPLFEEIFAKYNIPLEMKYLAIVESALNPRAKSRAGAGGIWQFIYSTGKVYDLNISSYVDERFNPVRSTEASAKYMSKLYEIFGDWNLVLAAYNSGPGNVTKAMRRSGKKNYWAIWPFLPKETRGYVPAFIAVNYLMNNYSYHNIKPNLPLINFYDVDTIYINETMKFSEINLFTGVPVDFLEFLNPSYKLNIVPKVIGRDYFLILPREYSARFIENQNSIYSYVKQQRELDKDKLPEYKQGLDFIKHKIRKGEVLGTIARRYGVSVSNIRQWNSLRGNTIYPGKTIIIYPKR